MDCEILSEAPKAILPSGLLNLVKHFGFFCTTPFMGNQGQICRLTYTGDLNSWDFAIYKYSKNRYDPNEWFFPGSGYFDGTVEGAMKAGLEAYPP